MLKKVFVIFLFMLLPANAGVYDNAMSSNKNVLLYMYTKNCYACKKYTPFFNDFANKHKELNFVKIDAYTKEGMTLMRKYKANYVPFIVLINPKSKKTSVVNPYCSMDEICIERAVKSFKGS